MKAHLLFAASLFLIGCSAQSNSPAPPPTDAGVPIAEPATGAKSGGESSSTASSVPTPAGDKSAGKDEKATPVPIESGVAKLSAANTTIQFVGTHMPPKQLDPRTGVFKEFSGTAAIDMETKKLKAVSVDIKTGTLETAIAPLTNHLRSVDFFDVQQYPTAKFESTSISTTDGEANCTIVGKLTVLAATKEIRIPAKVTISDAGLLLTGEFTLDRTEFGMSGAQDQINKEVAMKVSVGQKTETPQGGAFGGPGGGGGKGGPGGNRPGPGGGAGAGGASRGAPGGTLDPAAMFKQRDANGDGKLTGDEIGTRMRENLEQIDKDKDGAINEQEFVERVQQTGGQPGGARGAPGGAAPGGGKAGEGKKKRPAATEQPAESQPK